MASSTRSRKMGKWFPRSSRVNSIVLTVSHPRGAEILPFSRPIPIPDENSNWPYLGHMIPPGFIIRFRCWTPLTGQPGQNHDWRRKEATLPKENWVAITKKKRKEMLGRQKITGILHITQWLLLCTKNFAKHFTYIISSNPHICMRYAMTKYPKLGSLNNRSVLSWFWRLGIWNYDVGQVVSDEGSDGESIPCLSCSFW